VNKFSPRDNRALSKTRPAKFPGKFIVVFENIRARVVRERRGPSWNFLLLPLEKWHACENAGGHQSIESLRTGTPGMPQEVKQ
jgi:hypothetical protein